MNGFAWRWLLVASVPACALVQPLDTAAPDSSGGNSSVSRAGAGQSGSSGHSGATGAGATGTGATGGIPATGAGGVGGTGASTGTGGRSSSGGVGGAPPPPPGGSGGTTSGGKDLALFTGTWLATSGSETVTCNGTPTSLDAAGTTETWSLGTTSDLELSPDTSSCTYQVDVTGRTAADIPGQQCTTSYSDSTTNDPLTEVDSFVGYSFVISADGLTATESFHGNATVTDDLTNAVVVCPFTESATYTKE